MNDRPKRPSRRGRRTRGQAMVEFALVLPIFILVLSGIMDFGVLLYSRMTVINAAREGARAAVTAPDTTSIPTLAQGAAESTAANSGGLAVTVATVCVRTAGSCSFSTPTSSAPGDSASVTVSYTYRTFFPLLFGATIPMDSTVQMVLE